MGFGILQFKIGNSFPCFNYMIMPTRWKENNSFLYQWPFKRVLVGICCQSSLIVWFVLYGLYFLSYLFNNWLQCFSGINSVFTCALLSDLSSGAPEFKWFTYRLFYSLTFVERTLKLVSGKSWAEKLHVWSFVVFFETCIWKLMNIRLKCKDFYLRFLSLNFNALSMYSVNLKN